MADYWFRKAVGVKEIAVKMDYPSWAGRGVTRVHRHLLVKLDCGHVLEKTGSVFSGNRLGDFRCDYCQYNEDQQVSERLTRDLLGSESYMNGWETFEEARDRLDRAREVGRSRDEIRADKKYVVIAEAICKMGEQGKK